MLHEICMQRGSELYLFAHRFSVWRYSAVLCYEIARIIYYVNAERERDVML